MKHITRIPAPMFILIDVLNNEELEINEVELRNFMLEVCNGKHKHERFLICEKDSVSKINENGTLSVALEGLTVLQDLRFALTDSQNKKLSA